MTEQLVMGLPSHQLPLCYSWSIQGINDNDSVSQVFDRFCAADTFHGIMELFQQLCDTAGLHPHDHSIFYQQLKKRLMSWKAQSLWSKLDKRASNVEYKGGKACNNSRVLVIGAGPCGLRVAIEMALLGAKAVIVEKRDSFSRNNVLHLWPFLIHDLKALGAKHFFGKFCAGSIDHISIRTLQCILLKVALLLGVEVHSGVSFEEFVEPRLDEMIEKAGWRAKVSPSDHPVSEFIFHVCFSADGKRNTMTEFKRKELRGRFAIGITANFVNRKTQVEASVEEISGVSYIFNQRFFNDLHEDTGIDLENIVYYKDETHYFVMTAKKQSLLRKGVLMQDYDDPELLLSKENIDHDAFLSYAREAAAYSTNHRLPSLVYAVNSSGQPDVDMFDFTSMFAAEHACRVVERRGHKLLVGLVGDTLLEPFWPTGSGCARGFLGALDGAWMVRSWASGEMSPLEVIAERENIYQLLSQTKPDNLNKNHANYTIDPNTRYANLQLQACKPFLAQSLYDGTGNCNGIVKMLTRRNNLYKVLCRRRNLLHWFQTELEPYENLVRVVDLSRSWQSGIALCTFIHKHMPHLLDVSILDPSDFEQNNQLAFDILEQHCNILPVVNGRQMANAVMPDEQKMISYLARVRDYFTREILRSGEGRKVLSQKKSSLSEGSLDASLIDADVTLERDRTEENDLACLTHSQQNINPRNIVRPIKSFQENAVNLSKTLKSCEVEDILTTRPSTESVTEPPKRQNRVSALARDLISKFKGEYIDPDDRTQSLRPLSPGRQQLKDVCHFCKERVLVIERCIAEGMLFHRRCFRCEYCSRTLDVTSYSCKVTDAGKDIFCHASCHEAHMRKKEKPIQNFNSQSSWVIAPVDRATFETTRKILLKQSQMNKNELLKKKNTLDLLNRQNSYVAMDCDDFISLTEEELCFSDDSDSEKPDLSWDVCIRLKEEKAEIFTSSDLEKRHVLDIKTMEDGASEADWETDSSESEAERHSTELEDFAENDDIVKTDPRLQKSNNRTTGNAADSMPQNDNFKQIDVQSRLQNRKAFFDAIPEPVRINAHQFLGLDPRQLSPSNNSRSDNSDHKMDEEEAMVVLKDDISQEINEEESLQIVENEGSEEMQIDVKAEKQKKRLKRKKQRKTKTKKLQKTKKQMTGKRTSEDLCRTAVASASVAAVHQTVSLVPLSEESSSDAEDSSVGSEPMTQADYVQSQSVSGKGSTTGECSDWNHPEICLSSCDGAQSTLQENTDLSTEKMDSLHLSAVSAESKDQSAEMPFHPESGRTAPRPDLLSAEAMFRSYEDSNTVTTASSSEPSDSSCEDNTQPLVLEEDGKCLDNEENLKEEGINEALLLQHPKDLETKELDGEAEVALRRSKSDDLIFERHSVRQNNGGGKKDSKQETECTNLIHNSTLKNDGCEETLTQMKTDSCSDGKGNTSLLDTLHVDSCNTQQMEISEVKLCTELGLDIPFIDIKSADNQELCSIGSNRDGEAEKLTAGDVYNLVQPAESDDELEVEEVFPVEGEFLGHKKGKKLVKNVAPKAEVESFSEDDKETSNKGLNVQEVCRNLKHTNKENPVNSPDLLLRLDDLLKSLSSSSEFHTHEPSATDSLSLNDGVKSACDKLSVHHVCGQQLDFQKKLEVKRASDSHCPASESSVNVEASLNVSGTKEFVSEPNFSKAEICSCVEKGTEEKLQTSGKAIFISDDIDSLDSDDDEESASGKKASYARHNCSPTIEMKEMVDVKEGKKLEGKTLLSDAAENKVTENENNIVSGRVSADRKQEGCNLGDGTKSDMQKDSESNLLTSSSKGARDECMSSLAPASLLDAKRKFFQEIAKPVRINPCFIFKDDFVLRDACESGNEMGPVSDESVISSMVTSVMDNLEIGHAAGIEEEDRCGVPMKAEQKIKRRLLPTIPTDQTPLELSDTSLLVSALSQADDLKLGRSKKVPNSLSQSEREINQKPEYFGKQLLPSCDIFSCIGMLQASAVMDFNKSGVTVRRHVSLPSGQLCTLTDKSKPVGIDAEPEQTRLNSKNCDFQGGLDVQKLINDSEKIRKKHLLVAADCTKQDVSWKGSVASETPVASVHESEALKYRKKLSQSSQDLTVTSQTNQVDVNSNLESAVENN